jgi:hypothetical protein
VVFDRGSERNRGLEDTSEQAPGLDHSAADGRGDMHRLAIIIPWQRRLIRAFPMRDFPTSGKMKAAIDALGGNELFKLRYVRTDPLKRARGGSLENQPAGSATGPVAHATRLENRSGNSLPGQMIRGRGTREAGADYGHLGGMFAALGMWDLVEGPRRRTPLSLRLLHE